MFRCLAVCLAASLFWTVPPTAQAQYLGPVVVNRNFAPNVLRGEVLFALPPEVQLNGKNVRTAPGIRIRNEHNLLVMSQTLIGKKYLVNYALEESTGLIRDIWILNPKEIANEPWPRTSEESKTWQFDSASQRWIRH